MLEKQDSILNELKFRVDRLLKQYTSSLEKNNIQREQIEKLSSEVDHLKQENKLLSEELKTVKVANAMSGGEDGSHLAKMRINQLVREIDKCIALLNN